MIELRAQTNENYGCAFFKCPRNDLSLIWWQSLFRYPLDVFFYEWQSSYLNKLVILGIIVINLVLRFNHAWWVYTRRTSFHVGEKAACA